MGEQACALAKAVDYQSAGTVEFIVDPWSNFYFLEMNTRLQVEHPVTEYTTGVDLVEQMIRVAAGEPLRFSQEDVLLHGWSFEARVYAENPLSNFMPSIGTLLKYQEPVGKDIRVDSGIAEGSEISIHYDPLISKLITHGKTRQQALDTLKAALDGYLIRGVTSNISFLRALCDHPKFIRGDLSTNFIAEEFPDGFSTPKLYGRDVPLVLGAFLSQYIARVVSGSQLTGGQLDSFQAEEFVEMSLHDLIVSIKDNQVYRVMVDVHDVHDDMSSFVDESDDEPGEHLFNDEMEPFDELVNSMSNNAFHEEPTLKFTLHYNLLDPDVDAEQHDVYSDETNEVELVSTYNSSKLGFSITRKKQPGVLQHTAIVQADESKTDAYTTFKSLYKGNWYEAQVLTEHQYEMFSLFPVRETEDSSKLVISPMPGKVVSINVAVGDDIAAGMEVCVVEAMKMQNSLRAATDGKVKEVLVTEGVTVSADDVIVRFH
jgi:propionyl-CoA carboxylase alpha chain